MLGFLSGLISTSTTVTRYDFHRCDCVPLRSIYRSLKMSEKTPYPILKGYKHEEALRKTPLHVKTP